MNENQINDNLTADFNSAKSSYDVAKKEFDFYVEAQGTYIAGKNNKQNRYDIIQARPDKAKPALHLQSIDLKKDMRILDVMIEKNKGDMTPWEVEVEHRKGIMNSTRAAMETHRRSMTQVSASDIEYLKKQTRINMPFEEKQRWINKLDGGMEEFNHLVPMI